MLAYYSITAFVTLYIEEILHDECDDYVRFFISDNTTGERSNRKKVKVRYSQKGSPYFFHNRKRIYLDECMRINK